MKYIIRIAYALLSLATIPAANAATFSAPQGHTPAIQQDWTNG